MFLMSSNDAKMSGALKIAVKIFPTYFVKKLLCKQPKLI